MRLVYGFGILASVVLGFFIVASAPATKMSTSSALEEIERKYLRQDLSADDKRNLNFLSGWIEHNEKGSRVVLRSVRLLGCGACSVLFIQSFIGLASACRRAK